MLRLLAFGFLAGLLAALLLAVALVLARDAFFVSAVLAIVASVPTVVAPLLAVVLASLHSDRTCQHQGQFGMALKRIRSGLRGRD
jgi:CHASE2 domain-containing sensor protein